MKAKEQPFFYGGQAVIEGVMMRGKNAMAIAVRRASGEIVLRRDDLTSILKRFPWLKTPFVRGVFALGEALVIGVRALTFSAQQFAEEEEEELGTKELVLTMGLAFLLTIGLFVVLPALVIKFIQGYIGSNFVLNFVEGIVKITFFLAYVAGISFMKDIQRVFQYHGAEHKAINCLEAGESLTVENVAGHSRFHKRCGTSFILFVLMISILVFSFFGRPPFLLRVTYHLALLPLVAGIAYEVIRMAGRKGAPAIFGWISLPGLWTQALTTREPDGSQIEVAVRSLEAVLEQDVEALEPLGSAGQSEVAVP